MGASLPPGVRARYHFKRLPIPGYIDTTYVGADGVHVLGVFLQAPANSPSFDQAPVNYVTLGLPTRGAFARALAHVTKGAWQADARRVHRQ